MKKVFLLSLLSLYFNSYSNSTDSLSNSLEFGKAKKKEGKYLRDKTVVPMPIFFRLPETGFAGGALISSTFRFKKDSSTANPSQISFGGAYTQKKQIAIDLPFTVFLDNNNYFLNGELGWFRYDYMYFGIGENKTDGESYGVDYPRIKVLATKLIAKDLYAGLRYLYEDYKITSTEEGKELASQTIPGSIKSRTSAFGISLLKDSRDSVFYPRKGIFGEFYILPTLKAVGADRNFNRIVLDIASYQSLTKKIVLASNLYGNFIQGDDIPFSQLSMLGGSKKMRGIFEGQFRDKNLLLLQTEARFELWKFLGLATFGSLGWIGNEKDFIRFQQPKFTYGTGLRIKVIKKEHINLRIDYALQPKEKGNFYLTVGEAF